MTEAKRAIEAILFVSSEPLEEQLLAQLTELGVSDVAALMEDLADEYERRDGGIRLVRVAGGWRFHTHPDLYAYVERYAIDGMPTRLSSAALETMAIVAYKQPISRAQISAIRGVNADGVLKTLTQRGYVAEVGRDDGAGQAILFGTTDFFLERLGLNSIDDLSPLGDFVPSAKVIEALERSLSPESHDVIDGIIDAAPDVRSEFEDIEGIESIEPIDEIVITPEVTDSGERFSEAN